MTIELKLCSQLSTHTHTHIMASEVANDRLLDYPAHVTEGIETRCSSSCCTRTTNVLRSTGGCSPARQDVDRWRAKKFHPVDRSAPGRHIAGRWLDPSRSEASVYAQWSKYIRLERHMVRGYCKANDLSKYIEHDTKMKLLCVVHQAGKWHTTYVRLVGKWGCISKRHSTIFHLYTIKWPVETSQARGTAQTYFINEQ